MWLCTCRDEATIALLRAAREIVRSECSHREGVPFLLCGKIECDLSTRMLRRIERAVCDI
jgi:hypothetical protein